MLKIKKFIQGELETNSYIAYKNGKAVLIDPTGQLKNGDNIVIDDFLRKYNLEPIAIVLTHGHFDHIGLVDYYVDKFNISFYIHPEDEPFLTLPEYNMSYHFKPLVVKNRPKLILENSLSIEEFYFNIYETPGHTQGSICLGIEDKLFTGDTIFYNTIGRTDLPTSKTKNMVRSLKKLKIVSKDYSTAYPGHATNFKLSKFDFDYFINNI